MEVSALTAVDAATGRVLDSVTVGAKPRFLTAGGGSIWTLNQGDGSATRVDEKSRKVLASIQVGIPGTGGDIGYGAVTCRPMTILSAISKWLRYWRLCRWWRRCPEKENGPTPMGRLSRFRRPGRATLNSTWRG